MCCKSLKEKLPCLILCFVINKWPENNAKYLLYNFLYIKIKYFFPFFNKINANSFIIKQLFGNIDLTKSRILTLNGQVM